MARMPGPDCAVMCNLTIVTHTHTFGLRGYVQFNKYTHTHTHTHTVDHFFVSDRGGGGKIAFFEYLITSNCRAPVAQR